MRTDPSSLGLVHATLGLALVLSAGCGDKDGDTGSAAGGSGDTGASGTDCADGLCIVSGTLTEDQVWTADNAYLLRGGVFIGDDETTTTLEIEPGTVIYGESSTDGMLVIRRGSQIFAEGTAEAPIVFTSSKNDGSRARGDWGGIIINGRAPINACASDEGAVCEAFGEGGTGYYGGDDPTDSSGSLQYVRVEFAGTLVSPDNELNGIAFQGVGSGTVIDYVQVHYNADDGIEFFGGTAQASHILTTGIGDDNLDWTDGWQGRVQYFIAAQAGDNGDNGIEADNNGETNEAEPYSSPWISNVTIIGSPDSDASDVGILLREGTKGHITNAIVAGWNDACLDVDNDVTFANADAGELSLSYTTLDCGAAFEDDEEQAWTQTWFEAQAGNGSASTGVSSTSWAPSSQIPGQDPSAWDGFFEAAAYQGAIGSEDWTAGWTVGLDVSN